MNKFSMCLSVLLLVAGVGTTSASTFSFNFDTGISSQWSGITNLEIVQGYAGLGSGSNVFSGNFLRNDSGGYGDTPTSPVVPQTATVLTLTGLPAHTSVSLGFLLAVIDSWDGTSTESFEGFPYGPDYFNVSVDNVMKFQKPIANYEAIQGYPLPPGVQLLTWPQSLGFNANWKDSAYDMGLDPVFQNIPHTANTLKVEWFASGAGWQGYNKRFGGTQDESWAIDNVRVDLNDVHVPLPPTAPLLGAGLVGLGLLGFRKKRKA
jgi:LPXTG-motif cell wall-anchored protein